MPSESPLKVVTGEVRLSFVYLFEPKPADKEGKDPKYSVTLLIPKSDTKTINQIRSAQKAALEAGKSKFGGKIPTAWKDTLHDGDEKDLDDYPEFEGNMLITVTANLSYPPGVVDRQLRPIMDSREVYSGCYAKVSMNAFAYNSEGSKGVSFGLRNVMKTRDGEPLGGTVAKAEDDFEAMEEDSLI
jgi:hypothetical protein